MALIAAGLNDLRRNLRWLTSYTGAAVASLHFLALCQGKHRGRTMAYRDHLTMIELRGDGGVLQPDAQSAGPASSPTGC